jgi:hypothetical protein
MEREKINSVEFKKGEGMSQKMSREAWEAIS